MNKWQKIALAVAIIGIFVSSFMLMKTLKEYKVATDEYAALDQYTTKASDSKPVVENASTLQEGLLEPVEITEEVKEEVPRNYNRSDFPDIDVDFDGLKEINDDVVAWLYVSPLEISYPVVKGEDNEYYLHHTMEGVENSSGCIFMDWEVNTDLTSWNTFFYGHNMKNGSMFGSLKKLIREDGLAQNDPYVYVFEPEGIYRYKMYSIYLDSPDSEMYWTCDNFKEWRQYVRKSKEKSTVELEGEATENDTIATLVTCSGSGAGKKREFVHCVLIDRYIYED